MKSMIFSLTVLFVSSAQASGTHCSGFSVHYVESHADMGMQPPQGMHVGLSFLVHDGKEKGREHYYYQSSTKGNLNYDVNLANQVEVASTGSMIAGSKIFTATLEAKAKKGPDVITEAVVCENTWALVP